MIPTRRGHICAILVCVMVASSARIVDAECVGFLVEHYLKYADIVFLGTVRNVRALNGSKQVVSFDASRVWKGAVRPSVVLYQAPWVAFDSYAFPNDAIGKQYLVFATRLTAAQREDFALEQEDAFAVPTCGGGTSELRDVRDAPRQLGAGRAPR